MQITPMAAQRPLIVQWSGDYREAYRRLSSGGDENYYAQRYSIATVGGLAREVDQVGVLCCVSDERFDEVLDNGVRAMGAGIGGRRAHLSPVLELVERFQPTHLIVGTPRSTLLSWALSRGVLVLPLLADTFHPSNGPKGGLKGVVRAWRHRRRVTRVVGLLNDPRVRWVANHNVNACRHLADIGVAPGKVIPWDWPPVYQPEMFEPKRSPEPGRPIRLVFAGSVVDSKGAGDAIAAVAELGRRGHSVELQVIGGGDESGFAMTARSLGVFDAVRFEGRQPHPRVIEAMRAADLVVVPSRHEFPEGIPMVIYEALAVRTPLICSDHPAFRGRIGEGSSTLIFPERRPVAMADAFERAIHEPGLYEQMSAATADTWHRLQCPVKYGEMIRRWLSATPEDDIWLGAHALQPPGQAECGERPGAPRPTPESRQAARRGAPRRCDGVEGPCDGVVFFGNVDWWYHNRGHSSTRTAARLARRVPTLYVNSIGMRMPVPGRTEVAWGRYLRKIKSLARGLRRDEATGLWVYTPLFIPRYSSGWIEFNGRLLAAQIALLRRRLGMKKPSAFVSMPTMTPAVERLTWSRVVAERCDDFSTMPGANGPVVAALERRLLGLCDAAAYASPDLLERERSLPAQSHLIGHGVDAALLAAARPIQGPCPEPPESMSHLPRPVVGFFGAMDDYRMDLDLMVKVARSIAPGTLALIGPAQMDLDRLVAEPNVRLVGQVSPEQLGNHAAHFDAGIIPFLRNDFNLRSSPVKLKEYLAVGFPIVAIDLPAYRPYDGLIETAETHEEFLAALRRALLEDDPSLVVRRREAVAGDDWEAVAGRMAGLLGIPPRDDRGPVLTEELS